MRSSRATFATGLFSATLFSFALPHAAHANFETTGAPTLPAFQAQATPAAQATASVSDPGIYYNAQVANAAPLNLQPSYAQPQGMYKAQVASIAPLATNGADPGVGPVVIDGSAMTQASLPAPVPALIEAKPAPAASPRVSDAAATAATPTYQAFQPVGYGYTSPAVNGEAQPNLAAEPAPAATASAAYSTTTPAYGYAAQPATYGTAGSPSNPYGNTNYGLSGYAPNTGYGAAAAPQGYGAPQAYAPQQGYGGAYGNPYAQAPAQAPYAQAPQQPPMPNNYAAPANPPYGGDMQTYAAPQPYAGSPSGAGGSYGAQAYAGAQGSYQPQPSYPNYGNTGAMPAPAQGGNSGAYPGYNGAYNASPTPQPPYGYAPGPAGGYGAQGYGAQGYAPPQAPAPQPDYSSQGYGGYAPYSAPTPPATTYNGDGAPRYSNMDYTPASRRGYDGGMNLALVPDAGHFYAAIRSGLTLPQKTSFTDLTAHFDTDYKTGWEIGGALGYQFNGFLNNIIYPRAELEVSEAQASVDSQTLNGFKISDPNATGSTDALRVFANGYLDFNTPWRRWFSPYIGGGIGMGYVDFDRHGTTPSGVQLSKADTGFAYNFGGGFSFPLFTRGTTLDLGYRYSDIMGLELTALDGTRSKTDVSTHEITATLRQRF